MEKLSDFQVLECMGRWSRFPNDPGLDVVVKVDQSLLTIVDKDDRAIVTWTYDAIRRLNPNSSQGEPARYSPDLEGSESLEIQDGSMISVVDDIISKYVEPEFRTGLSLRGFLMFVGIGSLAAVLLVVFSNAIASQMAGLIPDKERQEIGERILFSFIDAKGGECLTARGAQAMTHLSQRLFPSETYDIRIVPDSSVRSLMLPGSILVLGNWLLEAHDGPELIAGYALAAAVASRRRDPFEAFLGSAGIGVAVYLALGKGVSDEVVQDFAYTVAADGPVRVDEDELLAEFQRAGFSIAPFAHYSNRSPLVGRNPSPGSYEPLLDDGEWLRLRDICLN